MKRRSATVLGALLLASASVRCVSEARIGGDSVDASAELDAMIDVGAVDARQAGDASNGPSDGGPDASPRLAGRYTILMRGGANECAFVPWEVGGVSTAEVVFSEDAGLRATIVGLPAVLFALLTGTTDLAGTMTSAELSLRTIGTVVGDIAGCSHTVDALVTGTLRGDTLVDGVITYRRNFGANAACGAANACASTATFTGLSTDVDR